MKERNEISKGPKKRDPTCFQTQHVIIIPKGTILRQQPGKAGTFSCPAAYGEFRLSRETAEAHPDDYKRVVA